MPKLVGGVDGILHNGKMLRVGADVPAGVADEQRRLGARFEGDPEATFVVLVSTPDNPIPTDLSGNSALAAHKGLVDAKRKENDALEARHEAAIEAMDVAPTATLAPPAGAPAART